MRRLVSDKNAAHLEVLRDALVEASVRLGDERLPQLLVLNRRFRRRVALVSGLLSVDDARIIVSRVLRAHISPVCDLFSRITSQDDADRDAIDAANIALNNLRLVVDDARATGCRSPTLLERFVELIELRVPLGYATLDRLPGRPAHEGARR